MSDFSSSFAPNPCCFLANSGGVNVFICCESDQCGCGKRRRCRRKKCRRRGRCRCH